jgi:eukaryotic-like serine/threonine-protein kinase
MIGQTLGHYRVLEKIGEGGMGVVYRANDQRLDRNVALKILPPGTLTDEAARRRFHKEALALARLSHPNIGVIHDYDAQDGVDFLVMEYIAGTTLAVKLAGCCLVEKEVLALGSQIAAALEEAHEHGVVHSDLKPGNVMVTPKGLAKVLDFGLAKLLRPPSEAAATESFTETLAGAGTLPYMAPEQLRGECVDSRTDIHALGALLYQMATGQRSYRDDIAPRLIESILHQAPVPPRALNPRTSPALEQVILKCLEKDPESRYQSAKEVGVDLHRLSAPSAVTTAGTVVPQPVWKRHWALAGLVGLLFVAALGALIVLQFVRPAGPLHLEYTQLTNFADSVVAPALSPDGRMLAFIRGEDTFVGPGEIYVRLLPDGEPVQLTHDSRSKMGPLVFSPDGSRIAYSVGVNDTWTVPVLGGEPSHLLANAGGLSWIGAGAGQRQIMFSATTGQGIHMGVYTATESRAEERTVYMPKDVNGMAHRSFLSPDGRSVLTVEMDISSWLPCRVVPFDGSSLGKRIGRQPALCTDAAWSPDGRWMYFSANTGDGFHVWRQLYPDGAPEQVTSGASEEQGIAFAADGRSFVTSIGEKQSTIWLHDSFGDRQITSQGYAFLPSFSSDGKRLYYLQRARANRRFVSGELWVVNLEKGTRERLLPDFLMEHYNMAADDNQVVFVGVDDAGHSPVWIATLDGSAAPRRLSSLNSVRAMFGIHKDVFFVGGETTATPGLYHVNVDGSGLQHVVPNQVLFLYDVSPDGKWLSAWEGQAVVLYSTDGGSRRLICDGCATAGGEDRGLTPPLVSWSRDGKHFYLHAIEFLHARESRKTYVISLPSGRMVPPLPDSGFRSIADAATLLGGRAISEQRAFLSSDPSVYAFPRRATHRNIFRIRVP